MTYETEIYDCPESEQEGYARRQICGYAIDKLYETIKEERLHDMEMMTMFYMDHEKGVFKDIFDEGVSASLNSMANFGTNHERWGIQALKWMCSDELRDRTRTKEIGRRSTYAEKEIDETWKKMFDPVTEEDLWEAFEEYDAQYREYEGRLRPLIKRWRKAVEEKK